MFIHLSIYSENLFTKFWLNPRENFIWLLVFLTNKCRPPIGIFRQFQQIMSPYNTSRFHDSIQTLPTTKMSLGYIEASFLGTVIEGVFYGNLYSSTMMSQFISSLGLYCIVFILYLRVHTSKRSDERSILVYPISSLFLLCSTFFAVDLTQEYLIVVS